jgi:hypothetical protein
MCSPNANTQQDNLNATHAQKNNANVHHLLEKNNTAFKIAAPYAGKDASPLHAQKKHQPLHVTTALPATTSSNANQHNKNDQPCCQWTSDATLAKQSQVIGTSVLASQYNSVMDNTHAMSASPAAVLAYCPPTKRTTHAIHASGTGSLATLTHPVIIALKQSNPALVSATTTLHGQQSIHLTN